MKYKNKIFNKFGFSLAEALIVMFVMCTVSVAATPAITKYIKKIGQSTSHGMYICYYNNGNAMRQRYAGGDETAATSGCTFKLRKSNAYYIVKAVGGSSSSTPGQYVVKYLPAIESELIITGGRTGSEDMVIREKNSSSTDNLLIAALGSKNSVTTNLYANNVKSCALINAPVNCGSSAPGAQSGCMKDINPSNKRPALKITNCGTERFIDIETGALTRVTNSTDSTGNTRSGIYRNGSDNIVVEFYDPGFPDTTSTQSGLVRELSPVNSGTPHLINMLVNANPGSSGRPGAVLIQW